MAYFFIEYYISSLRLICMKHMSIYEYIYFVCNYLNKCKLLVLDVIITSVIGKKVLLIVPGKILSSSNLFNVLFFNLQLLKEI